MPRHQVVKFLWVYIKERNLQDETGMHSYIGYFVTEKTQDTMLRVSLFDLNYILSI